MDTVETEPLVSSGSQSFKYGSITLDKDTDYEEELQPSSSSRGFRWKSLCRVEVAAFLKMLELGLHNVTKTNLLIAKICTVDLNLGDNICSDLDSHPKEQVMVQERVNDLNLYTMVLAGVPK